VVESDYLITVSGAELTNPQDLWGHVLDWVNAPTSTSLGTERTTGVKGSVTGGGEIGVPLVAKAHVDIEGEASAERAKTRNETRERSGLQQVVKEIANSAFVVLIDDFHYVDRAAQDKLAQAIKEAAFRGIKICVASVPHRSDDVIRANPDLRGRVLAIDTSYWTKSDLQRIGVIGFEQLNVDPDQAALTRVAEESAGSPQLMQAICLQICYKLGVSEELDDRRRLSFSSSILDDVFERTSALTNYATLTDILKRGPKERGTERLSYTLRSGGEADVYGCILRAIREPPLRLSFPYEELKERIEQLCIGNSPRGIGITNSVVLMNQLARAKMPRERAIDWDGERQVLDIVDPYFLFFLRWSGELEKSG
jgi:hypothetical protein